MTPEALRIMEHIAAPFPSRFVKSPPAGKYGSYVPHDVVNQRALAIVGPHEFEIVEVVRGWTPAVSQKNGEFPERSDAVVGVLARLTIQVDGYPFSVIEAGDVEGAAAQTDGQNLKEAASDAYKRCWMRFGMGLHLWSGQDYELPAMLEHFNGVTDE